MIKNLSIILSVLMLFSGNVKADDAYDAFDIITSNDRGVIELEEHYLRAMFSGRVRTWADGTPVRIVVFEDSSGFHKDFCWNILDVHPRQFTRQWNIVVYSGTGEKPIRVNSYEEMISTIKNNHGTIGYIPENKNEIIEKEGLNVIEIK